MTQSVHVYRRRLLWSYSEQAGEGPAYLANTALPVLKAGLAARESILKGLQMRQTSKNTDLNCERGESSDNDSNAVFKGGAVNAVWRFWRALAANVQRGKAAKPAHVIWISSKVGLLPQSLTAPQVAFTQLRESTPPSLIFSSPAYFISGDHL